MNTFKELGLSKSVLDNLDQLGFETPTPIQEQAIPMLLSNDPTDFIGLAQTGTGKTAAFGLPLIDLVDLENKHTQVLIMAPTRELGQQTAQHLKSFCQNNKALNVEVVYGGAAITNQIKALKKPTQIIVATPGRLLDLIKRRAVSLNKVRYVVLDEADEMLNMGFKEAINEILDYASDEKVIWLFSATMPSEIRKIVKKYMDSPLEVSVNQEQKANKDISHKYVITKTTNKIPALRRFLDLQPEMRGVMFCRTRRETQKIADDLSNLGYGVEALHGELSQAQRDAVMKRFKRRSMQLLIATDVAARGIDVNDLTHVLHHTLPDQLESYTHRSGRTARAGKKGISLAFINPRERRRIEEIERKIRITFEPIEVPALDQLRSSRINNWANLIINTDVDKQSEQILHEIEDRFKHMTKEDLLKRLITTQLDHIMGQTDGGGDLNENLGGTSNNRVRSNFHTYFINIGVIDGVTKSDLIHFLSDVSDVQRNHFGAVDMQKNFSTFDVSHEHDQGLADKFTGLEIEGHAIRVHRDTGEEKKSSGKKKRSNKRHSGGSSRGGRTSRRESRRVKERRR